MHDKISISSSICFRILCALTFVVFLIGDANSASARASFQAGTTRYIASSGSDASNCGSPSSPCRTIQYAVNQSVSGDRILVAQGTYVYNASVDPCSFLLTPAVICVLDKRLTILGGYSTSNWSAANPAANPTVVDGQNARRGAVVIGFNTATTHLNMEGFIIQNGRAQG